MKRTIHKKDKERRQRALTRKQYGNAYYYSYIDIEPWKMIPYCRLFRVIRYFSDWREGPCVYNGQTRQFLKRNLYHI